MTTCTRARGCAGSHYPFLTLKERDVETGLDYFLARYYSSIQGRFTSPDEFAGGPDELYDFVDEASENPTFYAELSNPQSLNKYQYTYNNPLNLVDPDGHCPVCGRADPQGPRRMVNSLLSLGSKALDVVQTGLSAVGLVPGVGDAVEVANAGVSVARGNYTEAAVDLGGAATGPIGSMVALGNRGRKIAKAKAVRKGDDAVDSAVHGNSAASTKPQHGYEIVDQTGDVKKVGISGQPRRQDGSSPRANPQVNKANQNRAGKNRVRARIRKTARNRKEILDWEAKQAEKRREQGHSMEMHKRP